MGNVYAVISVSNSRDVANAKEGKLSEADIRSINLTALVDTGATTLIINEDICQQLGLQIEETKNINLAGGARMECKVTEPVKIQWKNRQVSVPAVVLPHGNPLLGVIPLEFMDLIVDPVRRELVGAHGDEAVLMAMKLAS